MPDLCMELEIADLRRQLEEAIDVIHDLQANYDRLREAARSFLPESENTWLGEVRRAIANDNAVPPGHCLSLLQFYDRVRSAIAHRKELK